MNLKQKYSFFWNEFLKFGEGDQALAGFVPSEKKLERNFISIPIRKGSKTHFSYVIYNDYHKVELTIQYNNDESARIFDVLFRNKVMIQRNYQENLEWDGEKTNRKRCKVMSNHYVNGYLNIEKYELIYKNFLEKMNRLQLVFQPYRNEIK